MFGLLLTEMASRGVTIDLWNGIVNFINSLI